MRAQGYSHAIGCETVILEQFEASLRERCPDPAAVSSALAALAELSPECCLQTIANRGEDVGALVKPAALSRVVERALVNAKPHAHTLSALASSLAQSYCRQLTGEAFNALFAAIGLDLGSEERSVLDEALHRFPDNPALLRYAINVAEHASDELRFRRLLQALATLDASPATMNYIARMYRQRPAPLDPRVRIGIASSFTVDHLVPYVEVATHTVGLVPEIYVSPFNSWATDVIDDRSALHRFDPEILFLSIAVDDLVPHLSRSLPADELELLGDAALERVLHVARHFTTRAAGRTLVVHSFHSAFSGPLGAFEGRQEPSRAEWLGRLNGRLAEALRQLPSSFLLDVSAAVQRRGGSLSDNPKLRHIAAMRLPPSALAGIADAYACYLAPLKGLAKKCVVLDLDNTLWGGIVGEDGKEGLRLSSSSTGAEFVEFQEFLASLAQRGVLLAINSKNNADDALDVIRTHEAMVLKEEMFSAVRINWRPKHENMLSIAEQLNIGLDSLIFVDDNPDEREQMHQLLPQVLTIDMPRDSTLFRSVLEKLPQLQTLAVTAEDVRRVEQYQITRLREQGKHASTTVDEYLRSLEIEAEVLPASKAMADRIVQLFSKTNQFNVTTRRYGAADVEGFLIDPAVHLLTLRSRDRFGDHGLVAVALVRADHVWTIDSFLMSCRVIGYGIETALMAFIAERARSAEAAGLVGEFIESKKNAPARDLYQRHGFTLKEQGTDGVERWHMNLHDGSVPSFPKWIAVKSHGA